MEQDKTMSKKIEDYLHLYYGNLCSYQVVGRADILTSKIDCYIIANLSEWLFIKPHLRPLSSMTEEEAITVAKMATHLHDNKDWQLKKIAKENGTVKVYFKDLWNAHDQYDYFVKVSPYPLQGCFKSYKGEILEQSHYQFPLDAYMYLLRHHFDLFNLIPEGLAIDATTHPLTQ